MNLKPILIALLFCHAATAQQNNYTQKIPFPKKYFINSNTYETGIQELSAAVINIYRNADKPAYYDDIFRLYFAAGKYTDVIQSLDSLAKWIVPDKAYKNVPGFHYRVHSMAMVALLKKEGSSYDEAYNSMFLPLYTSLPDEGKDQVNGIFERADAAAEKKNFDTKLAAVAGNDEVSIENAISLIKQWNFWQVYEKTTPLAKKQITVYREYEIANRENKLLGLDEGTPVPATDKTLITNVTLVDVEKQQLIPNTTVAITGQTITAINPKQPTADALVIDGTGKYLLPGLTDAHIHFFQSGGLYTRPDGLDFRKYMPYDKETEWNRLNMKDVLKRNVMNGITSVIDVGATNNFLQLRDKYRGKTFAPAVYMSGPLLTTDEPEAFKNLGNNAPFSLVTTEADARKMVQAQLPYHPDLIKIWYILEPGKDKEASARKYLPVIKAIIDESHQHQLKVAVHATERITAQLAVENGCDYLVHSVEDELISDAFAHLLKEKNVTLCPTLTVYGNYGKVYGQQLDFSVTELRKANPVQIGSLYDLKHLPEQALINSVKNQTRSSSAFQHTQDSVCLVNLKKLADAGVRIAAGTDAGNPGTMHGTSLLPELRMMKKSGMSNWQILQSATINPAYIVNKQKESGSIAPGKIADMVLLSANPVENLEHLLQISLVINKGHRIQIDTLIKETALALVQRQLNAYNARNLEAFLEPYADDIEIYQFPGTLLSKGKEAMRKDYAFFNDLPDLHCEITQRIIQGNIIIDKESVTGMGGSKPLEATAIYHIEGNKIKKVYFIQ